MGRKASNKKIGLTDLAAAWRAGWSPSDVNAILDRLDQIGDPNDPLPAIDPLPQINDSSDEDVNDENVDDFDEDVAGDDYEDDEDETSNNNGGDNLIDEVNKNLNNLKNTALEVENERLKNEVKRLQSANRHKDLSGGEIIKSLEDSLIDTFQSLFS